MKVRAKFQVTEVTQRMGYVQIGIDDNGNRKYENRPIDSVKLSPVTGEENEKFWTATPSGLIELGMSNPDTAGTFKLGQSYYVDFSDAPVGEDERPIG